MSGVRKHFCAVVVSGAGGASRPRKNGICGCIPAVVSSVDRSSDRGTSEADGRRRWPFCSKYERKPSRISADVLIREIVGSLQPRRRKRMALARVVTFEGIDKNRIEEMKREMASGQQPEGVPATEVIVLHDAEADKSIALVFFDNEDDYRQGDETLNAMPASETPGRRTSVEKYEVAVRMSG